MLSPSQVLLVGKGSVHFNFYVSLSHWRAYALLSSEPWQGLFILLQAKWKAKLGPGLLMAPSESHELWMVLNLEIIQVGSRKPQGHPTGSKMWETFYVPP